MYFTGFKHPPTMANFTTSINNLQTFETTTDFLSSQSGLESDNLDAVKWSTYAAVVYFSLYAVLVIMLSIHIHKTENYDSISKLLPAVWAKRAIYGQILVHLYDTATDIGVLVEWGILAYDDTDYYSIDMRTMFFASIGFLIFYRLISILLATIRSTQEAESSWELFGDCCLGLVDMYIIKTVYQSLKKGDNEVTPQQKLIQLLEAIFESLPQVLLSR